MEWAGADHGEEEGTCVFQVVREGLIFELLAIDGFPSSAYAQQIG